MPQRGEQLDMTRRTALYRLLDGAGRLLYIGIAFDPEARKTAHSHSKLWWPEVTECRTEWYETRSEAATAEAAAVKAEKPIYNKAANESPFEGEVHKPGLLLSRTIRVPDDIWDAYKAACANEGTTPSDDIRRYIHAALKEDAAEQRRIAAEERAAEA